MNDSPGPVHDVIVSTEEMLRDFSAEPFSPPAFVMLKERISQYVGELITESLRVAKRRQADTVSASHVETAAGYLISGSRRKFFRHLGTVGGILPGAAIGNLLEIANSAQPTTTQAIIITSTLGIVGAFMVALHIGKD